MFVITRVINNNCTNNNSDHDSKVELHCVECIFLSCTQANQHSKLRIHALLKGLSQLHSLHAKLKN